MRSFQINSCKQGYIFENIFIHTYILIQQKLIDKELERKQGQNVKRLLKYVSIIHSSLENIKKINLKLLVHHNFLHILQIHLVMKKNFWLA